MTNPEGGLAGITLRRAGEPVGQVHVSQGGGPLRQVYLSQGGELGRQVQNIHDFSILGGQRRKKATYFFDNPVHMEPGQPVFAQGANDPHAEGMSYRRPPVAELNEIKRELAALQVKLSTQGGADGFMLSPVGPNRSGYARADIVAHALTRTNEALRALARTVDALCRIEEDRWRGAV